ncbi:MAG: hypothetical protein GEV05_25990 [Betaproteobacteria bacterium]|nr:hypothetical protein [Betaproteobacteria bacterium]
MQLDLEGLSRWVVRITHLRLGQARIEIHERQRKNDGKRRGRGGAAASDGLLEINRRGHELFLRKCLNK